MAENENENRAGTLNLTEKVQRKMRKALTRRADGTFDVCEVHERRMRAESFDLLISADGKGSVEVQAVASLTCGHSKRPCEETKRVIIADAQGINGRLLTKIEIETEDEESAAA